MRDFLKKFIYLLDNEDRKNFIRFLTLLFVGGLLSLLGIGAVIPFVSILVDPSHLQNLPVINQFSYRVAVGICVSILILSFWIKNGAAFVVLKKQSRFLNELVAKIQKKLFYYYIYSPYIYHVKCSSPELVSNINVEVNVLSGQVIGQLGCLLNEVVTSTLIFVALLFINPIFSIIIVGVIFLTARWFMIKLKDKTQYFSKLRSKNYAGLTKCVIQGLGGIKETKIYQKESFFTDNVAAYAEGIADASAFSSVFQQSSRFLIEAASITLVLVLMFIFIMTGYSGQKLLILVSVFAVAAMQLLPSMNRLLQALANIKYGHAALEKIYNEFRQYNNFKQCFAEQNNAKKQGCPIQFKDVIELKNICFSYGFEPVLSNITLDIPKGKKVAFVGHTGVGKTTLVDIILGILVPASGELKVDGVKISDNNLLYWQRHFGYIPQIIYLYDCSLRENVAFGLNPKDIDDDRVWNVLKQASLYEFVKKGSPNGLDTLVGENGIRLSGGQRQRVGIARALYHNPDILVMDEATAALDNQTEAEITQALSSAERGRTIITIAHRLSTIKEHDIIYVLDKEGIVKSGNYDTLIKTCKEFADMVNVNGGEEVK